MFPLPDLDRCSSQTLAESSFALLRLDLRKLWTSVPQVRYTEQVAFGETPEPPEEVRSLQSA